ncbi:hypothetical protein D3H65_04935 [Paraflavitalea soli]|uniref:DUF4890 domain-containing protein n=1 Tax=Paraflavitalea soli TaxID=2315862 RepID=A0A3B7MJ93_9BACT|nr:hypothetical protein [Paraflavitalea soli]AXY73363.1 hypothetical protein D3H65_04935 [Paraflavitalea soli]
MKKLLASLFILGVAAFSTLQAQDAGKGAMSKRMTDSMTVQLSLTAEQVPKVQAINDDFAAKAAAIKSEGGDRMSKGKKIKAANSERDKALKAVLTEAQFSEYKAHKKENKAEMKQRFKKRKQG